MIELDQSKHSLEDIFEREKTSYSVKRLLFKFHDTLIIQLQTRNFTVFARTHDKGISYLFKENEAFVFIDVRSEFFTARFFTGNKAILGIGKGIWINKNDNKGSESYRICNETDLKRAIIFSLDAYKIATGR